MPLDPAPSPVAPVSRRFFLPIHLSLPALFTLTGLLQATAQEPLTFSLLVTHLAGLSVFYAAPHLLWAALCAALGPAAWVRHLGQLSASGALLLIGTWSFWGPRDASGLPFQWLLYWPLAGILLAAVAFGWALAGRPRASA